MIPSPIIQRLEAMRRVARRRLILFGVFAVLAGGIAAFFTILVVDWLVWLPPLLRIVAAILFSVGFLLASHHWIISPIRAPLTLGELAGKIERHFPTLHDRLSSSVNFLERGEVSRSPMAQHVVETTEQDIQKLALENAIVGGPVQRRAFAFVVTSLFLGLAILAIPDWLRVGVKRYSSPFGGIEWPRHVEIVPATRDEVVALGDSATVTMRITRGFNDSLRAVVRFREADGNAGVRTMTHEGNGYFSTTIDSVMGELKYWFEAGDAESKPKTLRVVRRPEVVEATALVEPPPYAANSPSRVVDLREGILEATFGGTVTVRIKPSKEMLFADGASAGLRGEDGEWRDLIPMPGDPTLLTARWTVEEGGRFRPILIDEHGFENRGAPNYELRSVPDAPPTVSVLEPPAVTEVTVRGSVRVVVRAEDDFGIESISLAAHHGPEQGVLMPMDIDSRAVTTDSKTQVLATLNWNLSSLNATPGDVISYRTLVRDNFVAEGVHGHETASVEMRLRVLSDHEFDLRIREDLAATEERLRRTTFDQAALHDQTVALLDMLRGADGLSDAQRAAASSMSLTQLRIMRQLREVANRLDEIVARIERNAPGDEERDRIGSLSLALRSIAAGPMTIAGGQLARVREPGDADRIRSFLTGAGEAQQSAVSGLREVLRSMGHWGAFQGLVSRTRDLLDRQSQIRQETAELGRQTLGRPVDALDDDEADALRQNQRKQEQLLDDVTEHLARLEQQRQSHSEKDPTAADAIDAAMRTARAEDLVRHVRRAAEEISANRAGAAEVSQRSAMQVMQKMLGALQERETRELALLRKRLDDAARQVAELIEEQDLLYRRTLANASLTEIEMESMSGEQRVLSRNARMLGDELAEVDATSDAGRIVRQSATPMGKAEDELLAGDPDSASSSQQEALKTLEYAREMLLAAEQDAAEEMLRRTLAEIQQDLQSIRDAQQAINAAMGALFEWQRTSGPFGRTQMREAARLVQEQSNTRALVVGLLPDMEQASVYRWALDRVSEWMRANQESLESRNLRAQTLSDAGRIVHELDNLIAALVETQTMPLDTEFVESGDTRGASGENSASQPPLPTMTELLVLKTMQNDINTRTAAVYARFDTTHPTEDALREIRVLGEDQAQVRKLAQMVTDRARRR